MACDVSPVAMFTQNGANLVFLLFQGLNCLLQSPEEKDGDWSKDKSSTGRCVEVGRVLFEGETMTGPVGKVGGGVHGAKPDHQHEEGESVED